MRIIRLLLATVAALLSGTLVNGALVALGHRIIPLPNGLPGDTPEALAAALPLMGIEHFLFPFSPMPEAALSLLWQQPSYPATAISGFLPCLGRCLWLEASIWP